MVAMNDAAVDLLDGGDCISLDCRGALRSFDDNVSSSLEGAIRKCLAIRGKLDLNTCEADRSSIVLPRRMSAPSLQAMVWPLGFLDEQPAFGARGRVLVMIFDPERLQRTGVGWLARRFNLRASEEALVAALVNGYTLAEAAEQIGIQLSTARQRLKAIQLKTGCSRQVDLIRLALRLTEDGKGIIANDPVTGRQVTLAYDPEKKTIGGVTSVLDPKTNAWIAIDNVDALKAAGLEITPERITALQGFAPTGYLAVGVN